MGERYRDRKKRKWERETQRERERKWERGIETERKESVQFKLIRMELLCNAGAHSVSYGRGSRVKSASRKVKIIRRKR